jgi:hypothetical protein
MAREPKRLPGDPDTKPRRIDNPDFVAGGRGQDYGIARGIFALLDRWKRRKRRAGSQP